MQSVLVSSQTFCDGGNVLKEFAVALETKLSYSPDLLQYFCHFWSDFFLLMSKNKPFMSQQHTQIAHCNKIESFCGVGAGYNIGGFNILHVQLVLYMCDLDCLSKS